MTRWGDKDSYIRIRVPARLKESFIAACEATKDGYSSEPMSEVIRLLMEAYVEGKVRVKYTREIPTYYRTTKSIETIGTPTL